MLQARRWLPEPDLVLVGDSGFTTLELLDALSRKDIVYITRLRLAAALYEPAAPRLPGTNGRPRTKGVRLPNLSDISANPGPNWQQLMVPDWYGGRPVRWVLVRDPLRRFEPQALLCTGLACTLEVSGAAATSGGS